MATPMFVFIRRILFIVSSRDLRKEALAYIARGWIAVHAQERLLRKSRLIAPITISAATVVNPCTMTSSPCADGNTRKSMAATSNLTLLWQRSGKACRVGWSYKDSGETMEMRISGRESTHTDVFLQTTTTRQIARLLSSTTSVALRSASSMTLTMALAGKPSQVVHEPECRIPAAYRPHPQLL